MEPVAHIDFETASPTDLRKSGVYRYVEDPNTFVWGFIWSLGDGHYHEWRPGYPDPADLLCHIMCGGMVVAHGASFERHIWKMIRERIVPHWPELPIEQQICTMARAAAVGLPQDLDQLGVVLNQKNRKDMQGSALMKKMARPRGRNPDGTYTWWDDVGFISGNMAYCAQDVRTEEETDSLLPQLSAYERAVWELDQRINDRGVYIDIEAVTRAVDIAEYAKALNNKRMAELTDGAVKKCSQLNALVKWINSRGILCKQLRKGDQEDLMVMSDLGGDETVRKAIELRREAAKTSTSKFTAMLECVCADGRLRGQFNYHGAGPGRWAGRLVQLQNLMRVDPDTESDMVSYVDLILDTPLSSRDAFDMIEMAGYQVMPALAKSTRSMMQAEPGNCYIGGDFSNIEGRVNAWLAGEETKLEAFREYDAGRGPDLYKVTSSGITGKAVTDVTKLERQTTGKVPELACGYQGGVQAFVTMAFTQNPPVLASDMIAPVYNATSSEAWEAVAKKFNTAFDKGTLQRDEWTAVKIVVNGWRAKNPNIVKGWWELSDAAIQAVSCPDMPVEVYGGRVRYLCSGGWLYCQLPSGRVIHYANPWIRTTREVRVKYEGYWIDINDFPAPVGAPFIIERKDIEAWGYEVSERVKSAVWYMGRDPKTKQWVQKYLYGGLQCENIVQGTAACLLRAAMFRVEDAGYPIILHAHDELLSEVRKGFGSVDEYKRLMAEPTPWAGGLPLAVAAWEDVRYVK